MYHTAQYIIDSSHPLFRGLEGMAYAANNLHTTALLRLRQIFTGAGKTNLKSGQKEVMDEVITFLPVMNAARDAANRKKEAGNEKIREQNEAIARDNVPREKRGEPPEELIAEKKQAERDRRSFGTYPQESAERTAHGQRTRVSRLCEEDPAPFGRICLFNGGGTNCHGCVEEHYVDDKRREH